MERGTTRGRSNAFIAGEAAGAAGHGVWVAVRRPLKDGGYSVGIVARLGPNPANTSYELEAAGRRFVGCLEAAHPEGIGTVNYAVVDIPNGDPRELMSVTVAGIPERGAQ